MKGLLSNFKLQLTKSKMPSQQQLDYAKRQTSYAWAKYYEQVGAAHNGDLYTYRQNLRVLEHQDELPIHLVNEIEQMSNKLRIQIQCPVCLQVIENGKLKISICGHKFCDQCFTQLDKCAMCRKVFKK